jgi:hypothetical protein
MEEEKQKSIYLFRCNNRKSDTIFKVITHRKDRNNADQSSVKCVENKS